ncbi:MAG: PEP-CTERM sorting domain-containing protein [Phycisphaeraceae bacterium]
MKLLPQSLVAIACVVVMTSLVSAAPVTLTTEFDGSQSSAGNLFDVTNHGSAAVTLTGAFEGNFEDNVWYRDLEVWYRAGSYVGHESDANGWSLLGSDMLTSAPTPNTPTSFNVDNTLLISAGETVGLLVYIHGGAPRTQMLASSAQAGDSFSDNHLTIAAGASKSLDNGATVGGAAPLGGNTISGHRMWNGTIEYTVAAEDETTTVAIPEPASLAVLGIGGLAMLTRRRMTTARDGLA